MLVEYIRQNGVLIGAVVATDVGRIGWSVCKNKKTVKEDGRILPADRFNKSRAVEIARGRAEIGSSKNYPVRIGYSEFYDRNVNVVEEAVLKMQRRAERYFRPLVV